MEVKVPVTDFSLITSIKILQDTYTEGGGGVLSSYYIL